MDNKEIENVLKKHAQAINEVVDAIQGLRRNIQSLSNTEQNDRSKFNILEERIETLKKTVNELKEDIEDLQDKRN